MEEELDKCITEEQRDKLIGKIHWMYDEGVMRIRDWMAMYEIMIDACEREKAVTMEQYLMHSLEEGDEDA